MITFSEMPRVAAVKTRLMTKEMGGRVQVAFHNSLGLCESKDPQFQEIKVSDEPPCTPCVMMTFLTVPLTVPLMSPHYQALQDRSQTEGTA